MIDKILNEIDDDLLSIQIMSKNLSKKLDNLRQSLKDHDSQERKENPYLVKSVIKLMANGMNKDDAILLTAEKFNTTHKRVSIVFWQQNRYMSAVNLYAKRYMCEKLKKAGFSCKQIASFCGVSENHIFKILRANADFWFLK